MRILHTVEFYEPSKGGAQEVVKQLSERLVQRGHDVTVATSKHAARPSGKLNGVDVKSFDVRGNAVKGISGEVRNYVDFISNSDFDVILNYAAQTWTTDLTLTSLEKVKSRKILVPLGYSGLRDPRYRRYFEALPSQLAEYDRLVYTSPHYQDKQFGDAHGLAHKAQIIPNGASREEFDRARQGFKQKYGIETPYLFLTVSNHYFAKGHLAVLRAFQKLGERECTLVIIGERPYRHGWYSCYPYCALLARLRKDVVVLNGVPRADVVSAYHEADLFLFGSRIECAPLVMYESFASRTPFITTDVGNVNDHREFIRLVRSPREMRTEMEGFLKAPGIYRSLAERARREFKARYTWDHIVRQYERLYRSVIAAGATRPSRSRAARV